MVHFGSWCIVSSPLILAYNMSEPARRELVWPIITNKEAIQVNQIWAGHPGSQKLAGIGNNKQVEVWTKPLGGDRTAALFVNTAEKDAQTAVETFHRIGGITTPEGEALGGGGGLSLRKCDPEKTSQVWQLETGGVATEVKSAGSSKGCWEITGCDTKPGASVGTGYGCKALPKLGAGCGNPCLCNGAWNVSVSNAGAVTVVSVMDGGCLQTDPGGKVNVGLCKAGAKQQDFKLEPVKQQLALHGEAAGPSPPSPSYQVMQGGLCVDDNAKPAPPKPIPPPCVPPSCVPGGPANVVIDLSLLDLGITEEIKVRDVWNKKDLPSLASGSTSFSTSVAHHGCTFYVFSSRGGAAWPEPFKLAPWMDKPAPPVPP